MHGINWFYLYYRHVEQQKQIQALQQQLTYLVNAMNKMSQNNNSAAPVPNTLDVSSEQNVSNMKINNSSGLDISKINECITDSNNSFKNVAKMIEKEAERAASIKSKEEPHVEKKVKLKSKGSKSTLILAKNSAKGHKSEKGIHAQCLLNKSGIQKNLKSNQIKESTIITTVKPEDYDLPRIIDVDSSLSNNTLEEHKIHTQDIIPIENEVKNNIEQIQELPKPEAKNNKEVIGSDWTMDLPKIEYSPESTSSRNVNVN